MIQVIISDMTYDKSICPLIKAFYPNEDIKVTDKGQAINDRDFVVKESKVNNALVITDIKLDILNEVYIIIRFASGRVVTHTRDLSKYIDNKSLYKCALQRFLYHMLSHITHKDLPWGILTGIRPTKLVYDMLLIGMKDEEIKESMKKVYVCSDEKIDLSLFIAKRERELFDTIDYQNGYSLYIGIPFCPSTCLYCSFTSYSIERHANRVEEYIDALLKEITFAATCFPNKKLTTVYIGGGTPTTFSDVQLYKLLFHLKKHFDFTNVREFCVEAGRPDSINIDKLKVLKKLGVNRISINPQSMQQKTLDLIGRRHTVEQINEAFYMAREVGFDNINMDIIIGLPGENVFDVKSTLSKIKILNPDSLTVHTLAVKRSARLNIDKEDYVSLKAKDVKSMQEVTVKYAQNNGYIPYYLYRQKNMADNLENIGYAKYGKEGLYNILIMEEKQTILALGAGGMSKFVFNGVKRIDRVENVKSFTDYISRTDEMIKRKYDYLIKYKSGL